MCDDYLSRVRAEALRRIEAERFEAAVIKEMSKIRHEEWKAEQIPLYHAFHEERKVKLREACEAGRIAPTVAEIETAVSEYALGALTIDDLYALIEAVDRNYPHTYANSRQAVMGTKVVWTHTAVMRQFHLLARCALACHSSSNCTWSVPLASTMRVRIRKRANSTTCQWRR